MPIDPHSVDCRDQSNVWPDDVAALYKQLAEEDRRLAEVLHNTVRETWPVWGKGHS
jgi:hypothetical protein